jgi:bifunctional non-homologous end joining protein LigD
MAGMVLEEYGRKRRFDATPEPPPKVEAKSGHRFVVQKHRASHLHYDFRLELDGVLKSWAVPRGPSLDPVDKRLAMQVEDHPVSYFDFEGNIPADNYGAGSVMVWDLGTWQPLSAVQVGGKYVATTDAEANAMLTKGDLKFRLKGKRLNGDFALVKMKGRRPGSKGNEWLLMKKLDANVVEDYDIDHYDSSVLTKRSMDEIAGDEASAEWRSRPAGRGKLKAAWLADAVAKFDQKKAAEQKAAEKKSTDSKSETKGGGKRAGKQAASEEKKTLKAPRKSAQGSVRHLGELGQRPDRKTNLASPLRAQRFLAPRLASRQIRRRRPRALQK